MDLAIVQGDPPWPGFRADLLMPETLIAVAAPGLLALLVRRELAEGTLIQAHPHRCTPVSAYCLLAPQAKAGTSRIERVRDWLLGDASPRRAG